MAKGGNGTFSYEIKEHIAELSRNDEGYSTQLNLISYNGFKPKYDVRKWNPDGTMGKGITLTEKEAETLAAAIADHYIKAHPEQFEKKEDWGPEPAAAPMPEKKMEADIVQFRPRKGEPERLQKPEPTKLQRRQVKKTEKPKAKVNGIQIPADVELPF